LCNAACEFCPSPGLDRKGERMSDELLEQIIDDLTEIPVNIPFQLSPFKVNEPFLDTRLTGILQSINQKLPNASITLTSNAAPITEKKLSDLVDIKNIRYLWISVNHYDPLEYTKIMQIPWEKTLERLNMIHDAKKSGQLPFKVILSRVKDETNTDKEFCHWVAKEFPLFKHALFQRGGWIGQVDTDISVDVPDIPCVRWFDISITSTGIVAHCCMDGNAEWPIGDIKNNSVLEIYNQPNYKSLRQNTLSRKQVSPCNSCTFL
ncbi:MAG: radical SAM/SPASM domain-containing protein, partial [Gammaproteobacteria bacterium]|nr:radical SAM/SPASM domain-containing protein [Gammaproteobacteria bacterium]